MRPELCLPGPMVAPEALEALLAATRPARRARPRPRRERLSGVHNPWGTAGDLVDSWAVLAWCQEQRLLDAVQESLGPDLILWDSELVPLGPGRSPFPDWEDERLWCPVTPPEGVTLRIGLEAGSADASVHLRSTDGAAAGDGTAMPLAPGHSLLQAMTTAYRCPPADTAVTGWELWIRYMPAHCHFNRSPAHPGNRQVAMRWPLINYTRRPLWLVRGEDRGGNDFVTGFNRPVGQWTEAPW